MFAIKTNGRRTNPPSSSRKRRGKVHRRQRVMSSLSGNLPTPSSLATQRWFAEPNQRSGQVMLKRFSLVWRRDVESTATPIGCS